MSTNTPPGKWYQRLLPRRPTFPNARRRCDLVVVSAVADGEWIGIEDLLDSLATYLDCSYEVVITDDATTDGTYNRLLDSRCWVVRNPEKLYLNGLELSLRRAFSEAHRMFDAQIYLKIDPDALILGTGLFSTLKNAFAYDQQIGLLGTYHFSCDGSVRDLSYWKNKMELRKQDFGKPYDLAIGNGYQIGDGVQGGAYAMTRDCLNTIINRGWFTGKDNYNPSHHKPHRIAEDTLITMLAYAAGFKAEDFGGPGQPFGVRHKELPMPPEELIRQNKLIAHPIKYHDEFSQQTRAYFKNIRNEHNSTK